MLNVKRFLQKLFASTSAPVIIISGLPRSGTSMMMKMLEAGGLAVLTDNIRVADVDNPKGYYEFERVKALDKGDVVWLPEAQGKVVKVISALLKHLPSNYRYQVIFMQRNMAEILASQKKMLVRRNEPTDKVSDEKLAGLYKKHVADITDWLQKQENITVMYVSYNDFLENPLHYVEQVNQFLDGVLDVGKMIDVVDPTLYRQRGNPKKVVICPKE